MKRLNCIISALAGLALIVGPLAAQAAQSSKPASVTQPASSAKSAAAAAVTTAPTAPQTNGIEAIHKFYVQLVDTMKQGDQLGYSGRYKKLEPAIRATFNLPLMTRFAVGPEWAKATPEEQKQLVSAFSDFSVATYASQFKSYDGEAFKILDQKPEDGGVLVETQLIPKDSAPVTINYLMKPDDQGNMRIVDVFLDGAISELAARRSEFTSIVRRDGIPALVNSLGDKTKQMGPS